MNTKNLKAYAPKARRQFIEAIKKRAAQLGIYEDRFAEVQVEGGAAIIEGRAFSKKQGEQRKRLEQKIEEKPLASHKERYNLFIREMAYTWFNRLAAIRYMELHDYLEHGFRVLSNPNSPDSLPEILDHASDVVDILDPNSASNGQKYLDKNHIIELQLAGNKEEELYRELLLGQCHYLYNIMPFMFEAIDDATELLLPDNLTKTDSILKGLVNDIPEEDWSEIEVIGWLYQFYISEHKDAVIGKVVKSEDIPAATQLFTPNWIVKYLVQNSLGRQWLATYPESELKGKMEYYIEPAEQSDDVIKQLKAITPISIDPEQIKVLDPAAGSGHILVEVYEVLREIYLERGYRLREIPELILTKNIYGLDIDDRAAQLAGFALMMKAREDDRRIFQRVEDGEVALNVYSLQPTEGYNVQDLWKRLNFKNVISSASIQDMFAENEAFDPVGKDEVGDYFVLLNMLIEAFKKAKTLGSLIDLKRFMQDELISKKDAVTRLDIYREKLNKASKKASDNLEAASEIENEIVDLYSQLIYQRKAISQFENILDNLCNNLAGFLNELKILSTSSDPSAKETANKLVPIVNQAVTLAQQYDVVVANPPYMGSKYQTPDVKKYLKANFKGYDRDLFSAFIVRNIEYAKTNGNLGFMTPFVWMFISSFEKLRDKLVEENTITSLVQLEYSAFEAATVPICTFTLTKGLIPKIRSSFVRLSEFKGADIQGVKTLEAIRNKDCSWFFETKPEDFKKIPGNLISYWVSDSIRESFVQNKSINSSAQTLVGLQTDDNERFIRYWQEVSFSNLFLSATDKHEFSSSNTKWAPISKGGGFRKWYGLNQSVVNWEKDGFEIRDFTKDSSGGRINNEEFYFVDGVTWGLISNSLPSFRYEPSGFIFNVSGPKIFTDNHVELYCSFLNSIVAQTLLDILTPSLNLTPGTLGQLPYLKLEGDLNQIKDITNKAIELSQIDWDSFETSWNFKTHPITNSQKEQKTTIKLSYESWINRNESIIDEMKKIESENNSFYLNKFGLQDEISSEVPEQEITLSINPAYRFGIELDKCKRTKKFQSESLKELISYSIGCMMGRYSLNREGLVYAHSGNEGFKELVAEGAYQKFPADDDGIIPLASEDWLFDDDATTRFREFVKTVWGAEHLSENLEFVAQSLCLHALKPKKGEGAMDTIRRYLSTQFFKDHCKTYKKRPIYWLFSSGKEKAFECLVYLHRYNEGTLSRMRTEYVTPLMGKYEHHHSSLQQQILEGSTEQKRLAEKALKDLEKKQAELRTFDEQLKHHAEKRITLDLDDGVKVNYGKFGNLLADVKNIHGVAVK